MVGLAQASPFLLIVRATEFVTKLIIAYRKSHNLNPLKVLKDFCVKTITGYFSTIGINIRWPWSPSSGIISTS